MNAASSNLPAPHLMPLMRYRDLGEAMAWLEQAFDFEKQTAVSGHDGEVIYGQMTYRGSLIMMGAVRETDLDKLMRQPDEVGGVETQSIYIVVDDADAHYARAVAAGADIVLDIKSDGLGRRGYSCRDPQGHIWNFGTYNPGKGLQPMALNEAQEDEATPRDDASPRLPRLLMALVLLFCAFGAAIWLNSDAITSGLSHRLAQEQTAKAEAAYAELVKVRAEKRAADALAAQLRTDLKAANDTHRIAAVEAARAELAEAQKALGETRAAHRKAEAEIRLLRQQLERQSSALDDATEAKRVSEEKLAVVSAAEEARQREEAQRRARVAERGSPTQLPVPTKRAANDHSAASGRSTKSAAAPSTAPVDLETSATNSAPGRDDKGETSVPVTSVKSNDEDDDEVRSAKKRVVKRGTPRRSSASARKEAPPPTYLVRMREVPWPYSAWSK